MKFTVKDNQKDTPNAQKQLLIVQTNEEIVGETTLFELERALEHHKTLQRQYNDSVKDLEQQVTDAKKALS